MKENIVLYEMPQSNIFQYVLDLHGLVPVMNELTGNVDLYEQDAEEPSAYIEAPYMNDASEDNYSEEAHYDIRETEDGQYMLTLTVDEEYLAGAQYPVTIDPTTTWRSDPWIKDAYVIKGSTYGDINFYDSGNTAMSVGKATQGQTRTYLRLDKLAATLQGNCVVSGKLYLYENGSYATSNNIQIRRVTESFKLSTVTWNTQPSYGETIATVTTNGTSGHELVADVTEHLRKLAVGTYTNYGLMLRNADETNSKYTKLYGTRHATTSKTPKMVVKYVDGPTQATKAYFSPGYAKKNSKVTLNWEGITTSYIDYMQYRIEDSSGNDILLYKNSPHLKGQLNGSAVLQTGDWVDGTYKYYIRAVDKGGIAGTGKGASIIIDNTAPVMTSLSLASPKNATKIKAQNITVAWTAKEANPAKIEYSVNGTVIGSQKITAASGSQEILASYCPKSGTYTIGAKITDQVGYSATKSISLQVDNDAPQNLQLKINGAASPVTGATQTPTLGWTVTDANMGKVYCRVNGSAWQEAVQGKALDKTLFPKDGTYTIEAYAQDTLGNKSVTVSAKYTLDRVAPSAGRVTRTEDGSSLSVTLWDLSEALDSTKCYYAVVQPGAETPDKSSYQAVADLSYAGNNLTVKLPIDEKLNQEGVYDIYVAVTDKCGNTSYQDPAKISWYNMGRAVYDGTLSIDSMQKQDAEEHPTDQWYLSWETGQPGEDASDEIIISADIYESLDGSAFTKIGTNTTGQQLMELPDVEQYASYRIVATYQDGSRRLSDVISVEKQLKEQFIEETEQELDINLTEEEADEIVMICSVGVKAVPRLPQEQSEGGVSTYSLEIETEDYVYSSVDIDTDGDGLLDGYELWELGCDRSEADSDRDGFPDDYEVMVLGTSPTVVTADEDSDNDGRMNAEEMEEGTDPYNPDSDFDGLNDAQDSDKLKTDTSSGSSITYNVPVHKGLYDVENTYTENGTGYRQTYNVYSGRTKEDVSGSEFVRYYYDGSGNNNAIITYRDSSYVLDTYTYDEAGNVVYMTHNGLPYTFRSEGQNLAEVQVNGRSLVTYRYIEDAQGEKVQSGVDYANGGSESYTYTDMPVTTTTKNEDGTTSTQTSTQSMLTGVTVDGREAYSYQYDSEGRVTKLTDRVNDVTYDYLYQDGELSSVTGSNGFVLSYSCTDESNEENKLSKYTNSTTYQYGGQTKTQTYRYENTNTDQSNYTAQSDLISGGKVVCTVTDDGDTRIIVVKNSSGAQVEAQTTEIGEDTAVITYGDGSKLQYSYDEDGNITEIADSAGSTLQSYTYDAFGQLKTETDVQNGRETAYTYDLNGNILSRTVTESGTTTVHNYTYEDSSWRDLLTAYDGDAITYDVNGNPLNYRDGISFTWQDGRQMSSYEDDTFRIIYQYNVSGLRTKKTVTEKATGNVTVTEYLWEDSRVIAEKTTVTTTDGDQTVDTLWYSYDGEGSLGVFETEDGTYYYRRNIQGDITDIIDNSGTSVVSYTYDAKGDLLSVEDNSQCGLGRKNPFTYRGYYRDHETGFYYLQSRYYDSEIGRFVNADDVKYLLVSTGYMDSFNLYTYTGNNYISYIDPTGDIKIMGRNVILNARGFSVKMDWSFLSKKFCEKFSGEVIKRGKEKNKFRSMNKHRISVELLGHAVASAIAVGALTESYISKEIRQYIPIKFVKTVMKKVSEIIDGASKKILTHTKVIDVNNNETIKRMAVFHMIWITWPRF